jgi:hypothetical protein
MEPERFSISDACDNSIVQNWMAVIPEFKIALIKNQIHQIQLIPGRLPCVYVATSIDPVVIDRLQSVGTTVYLQAPDTLAQKLRKIFNKDG